MRGSTGCRVAAFLGIAAAVGVVAGVGWELVVPLATYTVGPDGQARTSERALTEFVAGDVWFAGLGLVAGVGLGTLAWRWFARLGWRVVVLVVLTGAASAFVCWGVGSALGPGDFDTRLGAAAPGDVVSIELTVRAAPSLLVWVFAAVAPVLVGSSLGRDPEDLPRVRGGADEAPAVDR
ncbi:MAG: hypothetical protein ACR2LI_08965 [Propionibacteriaceae bacterium]